MADNSAEKYLGYAELAIQDKDYEDAKNYILMSLKYKAAERGYKMLAEVEAKIAGSPKRSRGNNDNDNDVYNGSNNNNVNDQAAVSLN